MTYVFLLALAGNAFSLFSLPCKASLVTPVSHTCEGMQGEDSCDEPSGGSALLTRKIDTVKAVRDPSEQAQSPIGAGIGPVGTCKLFSDGQVLTFDGRRSRWYTSLEFWIVKDSYYNIQGRYMPIAGSNGLPMMKEIVFGGPVLEGHKLQVGAKRAYWDGEPILKQFPATFSNEFVKVEYNGQGPVTKADDMGQARHLIHVSLPGKVRIVISRPKEPIGAISAQVQMQPVYEQDGYCGNFNGNPADDDKNQIRQRNGIVGVHMQDSLFLGPKTPIQFPDLDSCQESTLQSAWSTCKSETGQMLPSKACLDDACFGE